MTVGALIGNGFTRQEAENINIRCNQLPNLQLLQGDINVQKQANLPAQWLSEAFDASSREYYIRINLLGDVPTDLNQFNVYFLQRREQMKSRIRELLL
jgi:hypothetical protein